MKVISQSLGIMITLLALFNILRLLIILIESYFSMNFGIDFVLHNNYVTYGAIALLVVSHFYKNLSNINTTIMKVSFKTLGKKNISEYYIMEQLRNLKNSA